MAQTQNIAWFHCFAGIAGDMALGSLVDAGADLEEIKKICSHLNLADWELTAEKTQRSGIAGTQIRVQTTDQATSRTAAQILELVESADIGQRIKERALKTFQALAEAEGKLHSQPPEKVHFHEVGGVDAMIDIVGTCAALELLEIDQIFSSPVAHGTGKIQCEHGQMPNPPPAVVELLKEAPSYGNDLNAELTTPTGAALLSALAESFGPMPEMIISASGFGAGQREHADLPNLTQVIVGRAKAQMPSRGQPVILFETNLDDVTGEVLADTISRLLQAGAHDAWVTPIIMKKGRPAHTLSALADPKIAGLIAETLISSTGTLGIRAQTIDRWPQPRTMQTIQVEGHLVRVKVSAGRAKPEHEDLKAAAKVLNKPLREVKNIAQKAISELPADALGESQ